MSITVWHGGAFRDHKAEEAMALPYADGSCDSIEVKDDLARFVGGGATEAVAKLAAKLREGGELRVSVPDFDRLIDAYKGGTPTDVEERLLGKAGEHGSIWNRQKLGDTMKAAGLDDVRPWKAGEDPTAVSLEAVKIPAITELRNVEALVSMPRLAWTENMFCAIAALIPLKINITKHTGAFWGQCLARLMSEAIAKPSCEWVLTLDYDSIFEKQDVIDLYRLATRKNLDAVAAMQIGRERDTVLITCEDAEGNARNSLTLEEITADAIEVATAHFGLTLVRADALRNLPKPWFHGSPASDGTWGEGRIDDDIQFWRQWKRTGFKVWQANRVRIGHIQVMVTWPDQRLAARHQYHSKYVTEGRPDYARS
jgi:hypothetical protein